jgi:tetratricopeptide (TPR) repeat protein
MKHKTLKSIFLSVFSFSLMVPAFSQAVSGPRYETPEDSIACGKHLSAYRTFFKIDLYDYAMDTWLQAFNDCPASSEMMYIDGVTMYRSFIQKAPEGPVREGKIDTLMLIYDRRMEYFGGEGNVLGRKGRALLTYRGSDIEQVQNAYEMLKRSVELEGKDAQEAVMLLLISAGITLNQQNLMEDDQLYDDYFLVQGLLDQVEGRSSRRDRTRSKIDELMLKEEALRCEALDRYFEASLEGDDTDISLLKRIVNVYQLSVCNLSDVYVAASESLYALEPGPESAHNLGVIFLSRNQSEKAEAYLKEAVQADNLDSNTRSEWYYDLARVTYANKNYCQAIEYAREVINLKRDYGEAYILLGDAFVAARETLGDEFQQSAVFWAAVDQYQKAASVDPILAEESNQKANQYLRLFPDNEEIFFRDLKEGDPYQVGGCINANTTVRSR